MIEKNSSKTEFGFDYKNQEIPVKRHSSEMLHSKVNKILLLEEKKNHQKNHQSQHEKRQGDQTPALRLMLIDS